MTRLYLDQFHLNAKTSALLWLSQVVNITCLIAQISGWMLAILILCFCWQILLIKAKYTKETKSEIGFEHVLTISPMLLVLFAIGGCIVIAIHAKNLGILLSMVHLLTFAYVLKAFEIRQRKDFYQILLLGLFLLASALIFEQNLFFFIVIILAVILNLIVLLQVFAPNKTFISSSKTIALLLAQSSILAIVLFVVFPRLSPFWQVPNAKSAQTGLSNEVSPGDIANLALSSDLAFRVDFKGDKKPRYSDLYWRAMTLEKFDGRKWSQVQTDNTYKSDKSFVPKTIGEPIKYDVIVEPSYQTWLFGLAVATSVEPFVYLLDDYTLQSRKILTQTRAYQVSSYLQTPLDLTINKETKQRNLAIMQGSNPELEKLGLALKNQYQNPIDRSNAILNHFREKPYFYTLQPPLLNNNSLDQFFFETKSGFCVHYASTYSYLMRAAGIPARVVTGYLGGEYNTINTPTSRSTTQPDGHLNVYQYDAHAWSEIWLAGKGWHRVDPTAAVDPQRVDSGWSQSLLDQQSSLNNDLLSLHRFKHIKWLNTLRLQLDSLDYQWTRLVLGFNSQQQFDLLKCWFGDNMPLKSAAMIVFTLIILILIFALIQRFSFSANNLTQESPWLVEYNQLLKSLEKNGIIKPMNMTPSLFSKEVSKKHPHIAAQFIEFTHTFEKLNYEDLQVRDKNALFVYLKRQGKSLKSALNE